MWYWSPLTYPDDAFEQNPIVHPKENTLFTVIGFDQDGCSDTATVNVKVNFNSNTGLPNAFSPNSDGLNDVFKIANRKFEKMNEFRVFNRNGQCVYEGIDPEKGWDGTFKGQPCDIGTYYYIVRLIYPDGTEKVFKGDVILLR